MHIDKYRRLALSFVNDFSNYTRDLLHVLFERENLAISVLRTTENILDLNYASDIQGHVACKFNVNVSLVRATTRNKLIQHQRLWCVDVWQNVINSSLKCVVSFLSLFSLSFTGWEILENIINSFLNWLVPFVWYFLYSCHMN